MVIVPLLEQGYQGSPLVPGLGVLRDDERLVVGRGRGGRPGIARTATRQLNVVSPTAEGQVRGRNALQADLGIGTDGSDLCSGIWTLEHGM